MKVIPSRSKEIKALRDKEIRALYRIGYTYSEISEKLQISRTTIFFAINNRYGWEKRKKERKLKGRN